MNETIIKSPYFILFVDDEEKTRKYFAKGLKSHFNIITSGSVDEAQKALEEHHDNIAVVITDQRMPGGNGVKLLRLLREKYPTIIRMLTTAYSDLSEAIDAVNDGEIFRYIQKPWDYDLLKTELAQAMELFELKLERDQLLNEKIMIKRKMSKISRISSLILIAQTINFVNLANASTKKFIQDFAVNHNEKSDDVQNWDSFEMANEDALETLFAANIAKKVIDKLQISNDNKILSEVVNNDKIISDIKEIADKNNIKITSPNKIQDIKINSKIFKFVVQELVDQLLALNSNSVKININKEDYKGLVLDLEVSNIKWPMNSNIFLITPHRLESDLFVNFLAIYLLIGHIEGQIDTNITNDVLKCVIKIPKSEDSDIGDQFSCDEVEDIMLSVAMG